MKKPGVSYPDDLAEVRTTDACRGGAAGYDRAEPQVIVPAAARILPGTNWPAAPTV